MIRSLAAIALGLPLLFGCMTTPEPCTAEWVDWKTERVIGRFVSDHRREIDSLRQVAPTMFGPEGGLEQIAPSSMMVLTAIGAVQLTLDFVNDAWPEITDAVAECSAPPEASRLFASMLRREGIDERAVRAIENLGSLMDVRR
jgi:hypothetical protein